MPISGLFSQLNPCALAKSRQEFIKYPEFRGKVRKQRLPKNEVLR